VNCSAKETENKKMLGAKHGCPQTASVVSRFFEGISLPFGVRFSNVNTLKEKLRIHFFFKTN